MPINRPGHRAQGSVLALGWRADLDEAMAGWRRSFFTAQG